MPCVLNTSLAHDVIHHLFCSTFHSALLNQTHFCNLNMFWTVGKKLS